MKIYRMEILVGGCLRPLTITAEAMGVHGDDAVFHHLDGRWVALVPLASIVGEVETKLAEFDEIT